MIQSRLILTRAILTSCVVVPLGLMGILSLTVLLPALKDPESRFYSSAFGYPALQRIADKPIQVETALVASKSLEDNLAAPGESVGMEQVDVRSLISGPVEKLFVEEGQRVRRGQPLLQLQKAPFENEVNMAGNNLAIAEKNLATVQNSVSERLSNLKENVRSAQDRFYTAKTRLRTIDKLADQELNNNVQAAQVRVATAEEKLRQIKVLAEQGAISKFQLYDMQDTYATRKRELIAAQQGIITTQSQQFTNQDFYIARQNDLISSQQALSLAQQTLDKDVKNAHLTVDNSRIKLQEALRNLSRTVLYTSTDGLVSSVNINAGEIADARGRDSLVTLTQNVVFKAYIDQARLNAVKVGNKAIVRLVAYPGRTFEGRVIQLNPTVQTNATKPSKVGIDRQFTYSVWVAIDKLQMPPGLQGYVQFIEQSRTALMIPESSVTHLSAGEGMVMVAEAGKAVVKKVKLGRTFDNQREVLAGLTSGEEVVLSPLALNPGDRLKIDTPLAQQSLGKNEAQVR
ncbi:efflux RND transporter periplasmic adaptor subunit [Nostoc sp.]|uniref:efflux RND transporter periplasmic adaptor subunit n=1 Tax=Nostoc sp. TaxID=1180 RepID=UPI002FF88FD8